MTALLPGLTARRVTTDRLTLNTITRDGIPTGEPVLFVHGNVSSSLFWQHTMLHLPDGYRPIAMDLRGFGDSDPLPVDATRGVRDFSDDLAALVASLRLDTYHLVGWSMGGGVALQHLIDHPAAVRTVTLVNPVSPYGFGGTRGADGQLCDPSAAGSGGGAANPEFVHRLAAGDRSADDQLSPRQVMLSAYVKPPHVPDLADVYVESMLSTRVGDDNYPGDVVTTDAWPGVAPGKHGVLNAISPLYFRLDSLPGIDPKPPICWIRGADDQIVSDTSLFDLAYLGSLGVVPGWPGDTIAPPQPMTTQTRAMLDRYAEAGGSYQEVVIADAGHSPHIEKPAEFLTTLTHALQAAG
jgi:pimeloyl-ACP methyl ester carboxylesterase